MELEAIKPATAIQRVAVGGYHSRFATKSQQYAWLVLVGLSVSAVYMILLPYVGRTWRATGDEPHYLLAAHSIVHDFDFDLTNNYDQFDYLAFYFSKDIVRQVRHSTAGQEILNHQLGLPLLIAPAYALGGRFGVLAFHSIVAGLLAILTFKLALAVCQEQTAALIGTAFVFFSPPLLFYPYLIYPELIAALLTTLVLYCIITARLSNTATLLVIVSLVMLPWLNRRFVPLALVLALLMLWSVGSAQSDQPGLLNRFKAAKTGLMGVGLTLLSVGLLIWFNSRFTAPARVDVTLPATGALLWSRLARGAGWLVDQQRGLFIFGPIYIVAVWGLPLLARDGFRSRNWMLLVPFVLSLGLTAAAGGFWIAWELGPRFLVVALPALASLFALAWQRYRSINLFVGLTTLLFVLSLFNGLTLLRQPDLPYKSSLPLFYSETLNLPLTDWLPSLGDYETILPESTDNTLSPIIRKDDETLWLAEAGRSQPLISATPLDALSFGHYQLRWSIRVDPNLPPETELLRLSIKHLGGGQVYYKTVTAADLPADGTFGFVDESFFNPNPDRWRTPMVFQATSLGASTIWAGPLRIAPSWFYGWFLPYLALAVIIVSAAVFWYRFGRTRSTVVLDSPGPPVLPNAYVWSVALVAPLVAAGYLGWQVSRSGHTYDAGTLQHYVGRPVVDADANNNRAWRVDPAIDPPQKAVYGPFDFYDAGRYAVTFRLKLPEAVGAEQEVARLQVNATANFDRLATVPLLAGDFSGLDRYQSFTVPIDNPRRQALSFEVYYSATAPLAIDQITVAKTNP